MNVADAIGLLMVVARFVLWPKNTTKCFTIYCVFKVILRYQPFYLGYA